MTTIITDSSIAARCDSAYFLTAAEWDSLHARRDLFAKYLTIRGQSIKDSLGNGEFEGKEQQAYGIINGLSQLVLELSQMKSSEEMKQEPTESSYAGSLAYMEEHKLSNMGSNGY